jgi:REP element-mobilizing transposase RayT
MPRTARIDIPGILYHVIARGIERRDIFIDDDDRDSFVERLSALLEKTGTTCFAWALLQNHFHLLLRTSQVKLATFMRRLLTGYAVVFNLRHQRCGHLFQNRYKSLVCQEDEYLLELVRYIHLNPLRANVVPDLKALDCYRWSGHSVLIGKQQMKGQGVDHILSMFGNRISHARHAYRDFVADGISQGRRKDLVGGLVGIGQSSDFAGHNRILGAPEFVEEILSKEPSLHRIEACKPLMEIIRKIAEEYEISERAIAGGNRSKVAVAARSAACRIAMEEGYSAAEVARYLGLSRYGVVVAGSRECVQAGPLLDGLLDG